MWIRDILTHHIPLFLWNLRFWSNNFDTLSAWTCWWFHNIHMLISGWFSFKTELSIVIREYVCLWTECEFCSISLIESSCSRNIFPHQIFAAYLVALWKMINFLVLWCIFELILLTHPSEQDVPFATVGWYNPKASCFACVYDWVIDVSAVMNLKSKSHIFHHHFVLMNNF